VNAASSHANDPLTALALVFHHVGVACTDLDAENRRLALLGYHAEGEDFADPVQGVRGRFLVGPGPRLELLAPLGASAGGILEPWLRAKTKLYHLAFTLAEIQAAIEHLVTQRCRLLTGPVPAVAFGGRPIAFLMLPNMLLIELIEAGSPGPPTPQSV